jgi:hypothetical protein
MLGALLYSLAFAASSAAHHYYWRELLFGSVLVTLGAVTRIKYGHHHHHHQDPDSASA